MAKYDIVITLITIVYGLMLTDLFFSIHRLLRKKDLVKWHWLPLLVAWYLFLTILKNWWDVSVFQDSSTWLNIIYFLAYGHLMFLFFLAVSAVLPDEIPADGIDLKEFYFNNNRYFWGIMTGLVLLSIIIRMIKENNIGSDINLNNLFFSSLFIGLTLTLALSKKKMLHFIISVVILILLILEIANKIT